MPVEGLRDSHLLAASCARPRVLDVPNAARMLGRTCTYNSPGYADSNPRSSLLRRNFGALSKFSRRLEASLGQKMVRFVLVAVLAMTHDDASGATDSPEAVSDTGAVRVESPANAVPTGVQRTQAGDSVDGAELPPAIEKLRAADAQVVPLGMAEGLRGFLVRKPDGNAHAAYVTETGAVVVGLLIGSDGADVTRRQLAAAADSGLLPGPDEPEQARRSDVSGRVEARVAQLMEGTRRAEGFWLGDRGPVIHVFADPACPYSVEHVRALSSDARAGRLRAHVIPVGLLGERSARRAVEIAGATDPQRAWETGVGGAVDRVAGAAKVAANMRTHSGWRVRGVPFSVWEGRSGVRVFYGAGVASSYAADVVNGG